MSAPFLDPYSTKAPSCSVFDGSLAQNLGLGSVTGKFGDLYSTKFLHLPFSKEVSHETVSQRPLAQPSHHFGPVRPLSLLRGANFEIARAPCLGALCMPDRSGCGPLPT